MRGMAMSLNELPFGVARLASTIETESPPTAHRVAVSAINACRRMVCEWRGRGEGRAWACEEDDFVAAPGRIEAQGVLAACDMHARVQDSRKPRLRLDLLAIEQ